MQRYVSASVNAKYFLECVTSCLMDKMHREPSEREFWDFVSTMYFEDNAISRNCKFWRTMKAFADRQSIARPANIWKLTFENADENTVRTVILYLQDEKLKRQAEREERTMSTRRHLMNSTGLQEVSNSGSRLKPLPKNLSGSLMNFIRN